MFGAGPSPARPAGAVAAPPVFTPTGIPAPPLMCLASHKTDAEKVEAALQSSQKNLTKQGWFDSVSAGEATSSMHTLLALPPHLQGRAIAKLDAESFHNLLSKVPAGQRQQFKQLVDSTHDPVRKLELWAEYEKSKLGNAAAHDHEKTADEGSFFSRTAKQQHNKDRNAKRDGIVQDGKTELDTEVAFLLQRAKTGKLGSAELTRYMANKDAEQQLELKELTRHIGTLDGLSAAERVDFVTSQADQKLAGSFLFHQVAPTEATQALQTVSALPPELQGQAIAKLDAGAFARFVSSVPDEQAAALAKLVKNTHDPERKLLLWGKQHKAQTKFDAAGEQRKSADEGSADAATPQQKENRRLNQRRAQIVQTTGSEVDDETQFLLSGAKNGKALSESQVDTLITRKEHEHRIEMKFNVNLTNDVQAGDRKVKDKVLTDRAAWQDSELTQLAAGLERIPMEHVRGNQNLSELRRTKLYREWDEKKGEWADRPLVGGFADPTDHSVHVTDLGAHGTPWRTDAESGIAHHQARGTGANAPLSLMEEVITHELGHNVHQQNPALFQKYKDAVGWESLDKAAFKARLMAPPPAGPGMSDAVAELRIGKLDGERAQNYDQRTRVDDTNKEYRIDPYSDHYLAVNKDAIAGGAPWDYARSNPEDHFAEHYAKAVHAPEKLYEDLKARPQKQLERAQKALAELNKPGSGASAVEKQQATDALHRAQAAKDARDKQWHIMREDVFHLQQDDVDTKVAAFTHKLAPHKMELGKQFRQKAAMCVTPQQLADLEAEYNGKL